MARAPTPPPNFPCRLCGIVCDSDDNYIDHLRQEHPDDPGAAYMVRTYARLNRRRSTSLWSPGAGPAWTDEKRVDADGEYIVRTHRPMAPPGVD